MKKTLLVTSVCILSFVGIMASIAGQNQDFIQKVFAQQGPVVNCDSGDSLSYDQAVDAYASGELTIVRNPDLAQNRISVTVTNNTICAVSVSVASYKMFGPYSLSTQSQQEFFDGSPTVNVKPSTSETMNINLPACAAQYDIWYGDAPRVLVDNQPYGSMLAGDQVNQSNFCVHPVVVPPVVVPPPVIHPVVASITASAACVVPGTNVTFVAFVTGDGITSKTLEKDTNSDGTYGQVASWGAGPGTNIYISSESPSYSGNFSLKLMVNGIEAARKDVTVNTSCGPLPPPPVVVPPVIVPPVVVPPAVIPPVVVPPVVVPPVVVPPVVVPPVVVPPVVVPPEVVPPVVVPAVVVAPPVVLAVAPPVSITLGGGGGPSISITKVPEPAFLPDGPGLVTYTYTVWNDTMQNDLIDISVIDDKCGPSVFLSGDKNNNNKLDPREKWVYACTSRLTETTTNTAVAIGYNDAPGHQAVTAKAVAAVVVGKNVILQTTASDFVPIPAYVPNFPNSGFPPRSVKK